MTSQIRRASSSVPTNIAEGSGLGTDAQFARHVQIALGSVNELEYLLLLAKDLGIIEEGRSDEMNVVVVSVRMMLVALYKKLRSSSRKRAAGGGRPGAN